jgi:cytochrome P450
MTTMFSTTRKTIPVDKGPPVVGYTPQFMADPLGITRRLERKLGPVFSTRTLMMDNLVLLGPDANQFVLQDREGNFSSRGGWGFFLDRVFPGAIMTMDDPQHRLQRRIMQAAFKKPALTRYISEMSPQIRRQLASWQGKRKFEVFPAIKALTLELATGVFMGEKTDHQAELVNKAFIDTVEAALAYIRVPVPPFNMWKGVRGREFLVDYFTRLMPRKRQQDSSDFFSQFCHATDEDGARFSDREVIDHMIFLMMAAHDTTTSTLTTLFYVLGKHPQWQERLREASFALGKEMLEYDDLDQLKELEWAMKEALRLYPPLTSIPRRSTRACEFEGFHLPADTLVGVFPIHTHRMESCWNKPERFDPERFSPARAEHKRHMFQWVPFGGGAHMCLGQHFADLQVKAIMHQILQRFRWSVADDYAAPYQLVPIVKPRDGLPVNMQRL